MISTTPLPHDDSWPNGFQIGDAVKLKDIPLNTKNPTIMKYFQDSPVKYISELTHGALPGLGCFVSMTSTPGGETETRGWISDRFIRVSNPPKKVKVKDTDISSLLGL